VAGRRADPIRRLPVWAWALLGGLVVAAVVAHLLLRLADLQRLKIAEAKAWDIKGPACPPLDPENFLSGRKLTPRTFTYQEVRFTRRSGYVDCASIYENGGRSDRFYPVCQFTSPGQLMVRTAKGDFYFEPGPGQNATVSTQGGGARCVMAAKISLRSVWEARERARKAAQ
jgi:hypothetical protein